GLDRHCSCRGSQGLPRCDGPEETCALEDGEFKLALRAISEDAEAGKAQVSGIFGNLDRSRVKQRGIINNAAGLSLLDEIDFHRHGIDETAVQKLDRKAGIVCRPYRSSRALANCRILLNA